MDKLRLHLDELSVESFDTIATAKEKGTVFGEQCTCQTRCTCYSDITCPMAGTCAATCDASCNGTCEPSCNGTCVGSCDGCTYDPVATCFNHGTCDPAYYCRP
jgi:hypothetical protein